MISEVMLVPTEARSCVCTNLLIVNLLYDLTSIEPDSILRR